VATDQLRCPSQKYGRPIRATGNYEVRCAGKFCRQEGGTVFHLFDLAVGGDPIDTWFVPYADVRALADHAKLGPHRIDRAGGESRHAR
jgi:hypothetical protein